MIPPATRSCGDEPRSYAERLEETLAYLFEVGRHTGECGNRRADPLRVRCPRCVARNVLLDGGWRLNEREAHDERKLHLDDSQEEPEIVQLGPGIVIATPEFSRPWLEARLEMATRSAARIGMLQSLALLDCLEGDLAAAIRKLRVCEALCDGEARAAVARLIGDLEEELRRTSPRSVV